MKHLKVIFYLVKRLKQSDIIDFVSGLSIKIIRSIEKKCDEQTKLYFDNHPIMFRRPERYSLSRRDQAKF